MLIRQKSDLVQTESFVGSFNFKINLSVSVPVDVRDIG